MKKEKTKQLTDLEIAIKLEEIDREPKKETLEQFMASLPYYGHCNHEYLEGIEEGAKWQAEQAPTYTPEEIEFIKRAVEYYWQDWNQEHPDNQNDLKLTQQILKK